MKLEPPIPNPKTGGDPAMIDDEQVPAVQWKRVFKEGFRLLSICRFLSLAYILTYLATNSGRLVSAQLIGKITGAVSESGQRGGGKLAETFFLWGALGLVLMLVALPTQFLMGKMDGIMTRKLRADLFDSVIRQPRGFYHQKNPGQLTMIINQFSSEAQMTLRQAIMEPILQTIMIAITSGVLLYNFLALQRGQAIDIFGVSVPVWGLMLVVLVIALCSPWVVSMMSRRIRFSANDVRNRSLDLAGLVNGTMESPEEIQAMNAERFFSNKHNEAVDRYVDTRIRQNIMMEMVNVINSLPMWAIPTAFLGLAVMLTIKATGTGDVGNLVAIFMVAPQLISPIQSLSGYLVMIGSSWPGVYQVLELMDSSPPGDDEKELEEPEITEPSLKVSDLEFSYAPELPPVFKGLNFSIEPGTVVGLVAKMGQGKTTFFRLALKFYAPDKGNIILGGVSLDQFSIAAARRRIALMSQFPAFFQDTVRENFRLASPDSSDADIWEVCRQTGLDQILSAKFGESPLDAEFAGGQKFSGGQCKLFALTRCLLRNPDFVFLDEPTTGMDNDEKYSLIPQIRKATRGKTVVAVDHDLPWLLKFCDTIQVLDNGSIVESGTGEDLLNRKGVFANLYHHTQKGG